MATLPQTSRTGATPIARVIAVTSQLIAWGTSRDMGFGDALALVVGTQIEEESEKAYSGESKANSIVSWRSPTNRAWSIFAWPH